MNLFLSLLFDLLFTASASSNPTCVLPPDHVLRIACTVGCGKDYVVAINEVATEMGYTVEIEKFQKQSDGAYLSKLNSYDALISPGGHDIDPKYYTQKMSETEREKIVNSFKRFGNRGTLSSDYMSPKNLARDEHEFALMKSYFKNKSTAETPPFLGICYGMQMMAVANEIPLYVDIEDELKMIARRDKDTINWSAKNSSDYLLPLPGSFVGKENHHQAVNLEYLKTNSTQFKNVRVHATSNDGKIAEILDFKDRKALGVQFHPEKSNSQVKKAVFGWLLERACQTHLAAKREPKLRPPDPTPATGPFEFPAITH
jgi:gamma-glutamyl-gamma-aminobutyrate hydrolase PuuD